MDVPKLVLQNNKLLITPPHNQHLNNAIQHSLPASLRKGNWEIDVAYKNIAQQIAKDFDIEVDVEVQELDIPKSNSDTRILIADQITIKTPYNAVANRTLIKFAKWDAKTKTWHTSVTNAPAILEWSEENNIRLASRDINQLEQIGRKHRKNYELSVAVEHPAYDIPNLAITPYPHQNAAIAYALRNQRTFIADDMGLGKTLEALATVEHAENFPALVVTPATLTTDWRHKIEEALPHRTTGLIQAQKEQKIPDTEFVILNYSLLSHHEKGLTEHPFKAYIFDESHYLKNSSAKRTGTALHIAKHNSDKMFLLLTGTPITNRPSEYEPQLRILNQIDQFGGSYQFFKRYCDLKMTRFGREAKGATNLEELQNKLRQTCYIRREKTQTLDLPEKTYNNIYIQQTFKQKQEYSIAQSLFLDSYDPNDTARTLSQLTKLRRLTGEQKVEHALRWIQNAHDQDQKTVTVAHHRKIVQTIADKTSGLTIIGGQTNTEEHKKIFQEDPEHMNITISVTAAAHGHTLTAATNMLIVEPPWTPATYKQTTDRIHRIGQTQPVTIHNLILEDTIDTHIYSILLQKMDATEPATTEEIAHELVQALQVAALKIG